MSNVFHAPKLELGFVGETGKYGCKPYYESHGTMAFLMRDKESYFLKVELLHETIKVTHLIGFEDEMLTNLIQ